MSLSAIILSAPLASELVLLVEVQASVLLKDGQINIDVMGLEDVSIATIQVHRGTMVIQESAQHVMVQRNVIIVEALAGAQHVAVPGKDKMSVTDIIPMK